MTEHQEGQHDPACTLRGDGSFIDAYMPAVHGRIAVVSADRVCLYDFLDELYIRLKLFGNCCGAFSVLQLFLYHLFQQILSAPVETGLFALIETGSLAVLIAFPVERPHVFFSSYSVSSMPSTSALYPFLHYTFFCFFSTIPV